MSVIIIHLDTSDISEIDSLPWPDINFNQTATYLIFIHDDILSIEINENLRSLIMKHFNSKVKNIYIFRAATILKEKSKTLKLGILSLLKEAHIPIDSLFDISEQFIREHNINLSTDMRTFVKSKALLNEFASIMKNLSKDNPALELFPLSQLKQLSERIILSPMEENQKKQLTKKLHEQCFKKAHPLLTRLAELSIENNNDTVPFENAVLLWNTTLWQRQRKEKQQISISILQQLEMSKECFLRELQERSTGYENRNNIHCLFDDSNLMKQALVKIYQNSFRHQEYIEIINATSSVTHNKIFQDTFANNSEDFKSFYTISIIGEQSGGKSFAMNKIFGTKTAEAKFKCTTGILASRVNITGHKKVKDILILDTEGLLDRTKKNTEAQIFDRKIVLEIMARSHIVLINITRNVNKTMQQILEIVLYGLNKLRITNKPKIIFLFRDQDPRTMGETQQLDEVKELFNDIKKVCEQLNINIEKNIKKFDVHEFPSPFVDIVVDEREMSFFNHSFCQQALSLRKKLIDYLADSEPFDSFSQWIDLTLETWKQINYNSNLFDYESLIHLTIEKALETFSNKILTEANSKMRQIVEDILKSDTRNKSDYMELLDDIKWKLSNFKKELREKLLLTTLPNEKTSLMKQYNLQALPETLFENTKSRLMLSLELFQTDHYTAAAREFQQDEFQKKNWPIYRKLCLKKSNKYKMLSEILINSKHYLQMQV
ncbi:unnamed protein product [Rotaria sp. Silwood2]|nr:unnamed protein product [Rotaria sp. Silwood2]CAF4129258.1 unnamed protein product [Rotaria sp. Silwood2]